MDISSIIPHIEALIFASERPLTPLELTELINNAFVLTEDKMNVEQVDVAIEAIIEKYAASLYPFEMKQSGGGWQFLTKKEYHKTVAQLNGEKFLKRLSAASLETLAIVAYKQPITKVEVESIRGVNSDYSIQKLLEKDLIVITGRNEELPGKPLIYTTSKSFMDYFGINSPEELPRIKEVFAEQGVEGTVVKEIGGIKDIEEDQPGNTDDSTALMDETTEAIDPEVLETSEEDDVVDQQINKQHNDELDGLKDKQEGTTEGKEDDKNEKD